MTRRAKGTKAEDPRSPKIRAFLVRIRDEMQHIGMWDIPKLMPEQLEDMGAFGSNTMAFEQWLRWVFIPNIQTLLEKGGPWPQSSDVGVYAIRNFDGNNDASELVSILCKFDELFSED